MERKRIKKKYKVQIYRYKKSNKIEITMYIYIDTYLEDKEMRDINQKKMDKTKFYRYKEENLISKKLYRIITI